MHHPAHARSGTHRDDQPRAVPQPERDARPTPWGFLAFVYALLVLYGSLYPFRDWRTDGVVLFAFLSAAWPEHLSKPDVLTNVLAYMPLGLFIACWMRGRVSVIAAVIVATLVGTALSFTVETLQAYLPSRVSSASDLVFNIIGSAVGALAIVIIRPETRIVQVALRWRHDWLLVGYRPVDIGLLAIALWALSQLTPLVPSLDIGNLRRSLSPLLRFVQHPEAFNWNQWAAYALDIGGLALLAKTMVRPERHGFTLFFAFVACVLLYKVPVVTRQLSAEALLGAFAAIVLAAPFLFVRTRQRAFAGAAMIVGGFAVAELASGGTGPTHPFVWIPFSAQMENTLIGIASITENLWPAAALAYLAVVAAPPDARGRYAWGGGVLLALVAFALEWRQQYLPGRIGDITTMVLMVATWTFVWLRASRAVTTAAPAPHRVAPPVRTRSAWITASIVLLVVAIGGAGVLGGSRLVEIRVDESKLPQLPEPESLPPISLPSFHRAHPRLPSPLPGEIEHLRAANPDFFRVLRQRAGGGAGEWDAAALQALAEPGSVDLNVLHQRLMALDFNWRGHEQGRALAQSYDWLYDKWSDAQRAQLRAKTIEGCNYLIRLIRHDRLSPYNVILYNAPLQALMACSIATYGDDPAAEPVMRFTYDLWKNRVLPVWHQVMGKNGGWHEGGEYVGIGIGSAVYQLPAMWRKATGEDLFATDPGIRGFADFLVYRTQPDATTYRWGDGSFFDRIVFEAPALAMEVGNAAAYRLRGQPSTVTPSAWPWGPLTDPSFGANAPALPLTRYFDGIGMIVARSDWSPNATYVTFKAGDNFWSHVHLDQGAFTIYKGGALAIDSGVYLEYGSDHHLNYDYQTIAHNTVTVTDPDDTVPMPAKKDRDPRPIANDGGQRRIGSGWGVEAAPLDLAEWESKRDIYHTGTMEKVLDDDGLIVGLADVTPAYTNSHSGQGTFSHRTRRVERFWRVFGYDRVDDVIVVYDQVEATRAAFRKRWLLHTIDQPRITGTRFDIDVLATPAIGHAGGRMHGVVLLPKEAELTAIGGPGLQFFVDNKNYDEGGKLESVIASMPPTRGDPGAWRIEVTPAFDEKTEHFLVVMLPTLGMERPTHKVQLIESGNRVGCEIVGPKRTTRWWFTPGVDGVEIETMDAQGRRTHRLDGPSTHQVPSTGWWQRVRQSLGF